MLFILYTIIHKCVTAGNTLFPCLNYLSCYPFQKINVEKKRQGKKNPISKQTKKIKKAGTEQCSGMKCCPAVLENQCHLEYWAPAEST